MRSSTYVLFSPLQLSFHPTPFCLFRVSLVASRRVASLLSRGLSRRFRRITHVALRSVSYASNNWHVVQWMAISLRLSFTLQVQPCPAQSNKTEIIRLGKQIYVMKWKHLHCSPSRTGLSLTEHVHWLMFCYSYCSNKTQTCCTFLGGGMSFFASIGTSILEQLKMLNKAEAVSLDVNSKYVYMGQVFHRLHCTE